MKHLISIQFKWAFLLLFILTGCSSELKIPSYESSTPNSIYALRRVQLSDNLVFGSTAIKGVVSSDYTANNIPKSTIIVQDPVNEAAIVLNLNFENDRFNLGDLISINLNKATLTLIDGELTVNNLSEESISKEGSNSTIGTKNTNLASLIANAKYWGPILVKLDKINISKGQNEKLLGELVLDDEIVEARANFMNESVFAQESNPQFVQALKGLARIDKNGVILNPRNLSDIQIGLLELLEDFETGSNTNYDSKIMNFSTGPWVVDGGITATSGSDPKNGKQSIRLQGTVGNAKRNGILAMNFDLIGVKTLSVSHGIYPAAAELANVNPTEFTVEVSKDGGLTYSSIGSAEINTKSTSLGKTDFIVNARITEPVRIRIVNTSIPFSNNNKPRINIDDIHFKF